jgi:hypothetical protein
MNLFRRNRLLLLTLGCAALLQLVGAPAGSSQSRQRALAPRARAHASSSDS